MAIAGSLVVNVSARTEQFEQGMRRVRTEVQVTTQAVTTAQGSIASLGTSLLGLAAGIATIGALKNGVQELVRTGVELQNLRASFVAITGSTQGAQREMDFLTKTANAQGLELQSLSGQYRSLSAATRGTTVEGTATRELFTALTAASRTYGLSTEQTGRALKAFTDIIGKGKLSQEELRGQLAEAIPGATQIAARAFNTSTKALEEMVAKGVDATDFWTRFTAQLRVETPIAAARAGQGIAHLSNELFLLKGRIAESGLLQFLDMAAAKLAKTLEGSRSLQDAARGDVLRMLGTAAGSASPGEIAALMDAVQKGLFTPDVIQADVDRIKARAQATAVFAMRQKEINEQQTTNQAIVRDQDASNKKLNETLAAQKKAVDDLNKSSAQAPEIYGRINGTLQDQIRFLERRKKVTEESLETMTKAIVERAQRTGQPPDDLIAQKDDLRQRLRQDEAALAAARKGIQDEEGAIRKAKQEAAESERKAEQASAEGARERLQALREISAEEERAIDALRTMAAQYSEVKTVRDADTASMLNASLVTSQYAKEAERLVQIIADAQKLQALLPQLKAETTASTQAFLEQREAERSLSRMQELLGLADERGRITPEGRRLTQAEAALGPLIGSGSPRAAEAQSVLSKLAKEADPTFRKLKTLSSEFADSFLANMDRLSTGSIKSFKEFANSIILDINRIISQQFLRPALSNLFNKGLEFAGSAASTYLGGSPTIDPNQNTLPAGWSVVDASAVPTGRAAGGPLMPGRFYTVGEKGPERLYAGSPGYITPNGAGQGTVNIFNISTPDAGSFVRSQGQVQQMILKAQDQANRRAA